MKKDITIKIVRTALGESIYVNDFRIVGLNPTGHTQKIVLEQTLSDLDRDRFVLNHILKDFDIYCENCQEHKLNAKYIDSDSLIIGHD